MVSSMSLKLVLSEGKHRFVEVRIAPSKAPVIQAREKRPLGPSPPRLGVIKHVSSSPSRQADDDKRAPKTRCRGSFTSLRIKLRNDSTTFALRLQRYVSSVLKRRQLFREHRAPTVDVGRLAAAKSHDKLHTVSTR